jgi:hypothetical protein
MLFSSNKSLLTRLGRASQQHLFPGLHFFNNRLLHLPARILAPVSLLTFHNGKP